MPSVSSASSDRSAASNKSATSIKSSTSIRSASSTISAVSRTLTLFHTPSFEEALKFADDFHIVSRALDQARATLDNVKKLGNANNFRIVDWAALEATWALDHETVVKELEAEMEAKTPVSEAAKEGLEAALALLDEVEHRAWWEQCQLKFSSMACFFDYVPAPIEEEVAEEEEVNEGHTIENDYSTKEDNGPKPSFEEMDLFWLDDDDTELREVIEQYYQDVRKAAK